MPHTACRLYLASPPRFDPQAFVAALDQVLTVVDVACVELRLEEEAIGVWQAAITALLPLTQRRDVALVLADRPQVAAASGCDGVYLSSPERHAEARRLLGERAIVGVAGADSRHQAMEAGELGADFVGLGPAVGGGPALNLIGWWAELMEPPLVAFGVRTAGECTLAVDAGADFLCPDPVFWAAEDGPGSALTRLLSGAPTDASS